MVFHGSSPKILSMVVVLLWESWSFRCEEVIRLGHSSLAHRRMVEGFVVAKKPWFLITS